MLSKPELTVLSAFLLVILCHANPINRQAGGQNTLRLDVRNQSYTEQNVCVNDDVLYQPGDLMPAPSPCQRCVCRPPGSQCAPVACEKRPGCKAVLRPDQCCPEYQCECERNGRRYANGERLDNAETPCEACYCQGGEVVCTTVECYKRDDCEPQFVEGKCCPKYDHCPPLVMDDARFAEPSAAEKVRPHHTRSTFLQGGTIDDVDDQTPGASNVDERIQIPDVNNAPATGSDQRDEALAARQPSTASPVHSQHLDAAVPTIKIQIPAIPWSEQAKETTLAPEQQDGSGDDAESQTLAASDDQGSGLSETEVPLVKTQDEGLIGVIEHITEITQKDTDEELSTTDRMVTEITTNRQEDTLAVKSYQGSKQEEDVTTTGQVQEVTGATQVETEQTTVSSEYTDMPEEMITTGSIFEDATEVRGLDLATEALLDATTTVKEAPQSIESSTDSSPEFKDFDEWTGTKSTEFQRDSSSSSSPSVSHSKPSSSSSDESTSHFLATNINSEKVKLVPETESNSEAVSSSTDSNESDSTEGSATTDGSEYNSDIVQKTDEGQLTHEVHKEKNSEEQIQVNKRISIDQLVFNNKDAQYDGNGQLNIVLDTEATDENGPPILLIGDELANHQMDIVVATVPNLVPESITDLPSKNKPDFSNVEKNSDNVQKHQTEGPIETTTLEQAEATTSLDSGLAEKESIIAKESAEVIKTEDTTVFDSTPADLEITQTEITTSSENKGLNPTTEKLGIHTDHEEVMLSDEPLLGETSGPDVNEGSVQILGKTEEEIKGVKESAKLHDTQSESQETRFITFLPDTETTPNSAVELKILFTESPEREATTNTIFKEEVGTTQDPQLESTISSNAVQINQEKSNDKETNQIADRRSEILEYTTESVTENPTTIGNLESGNTLINTERIRIDLNIPSVFDEKQGNEAESIDVKTAQKNDPDKDFTNESQKLDEMTTEIPTTQIPFLSKADKVKDFAHEEMLLGDQPQILDSSIQSYSPVDEHKKSQQEKTDDLLEPTTEMNLESAIIHEEIHTDDSELESESTQKVEEEIINDDLQDTENNPTGDQQRTEKINATPANIKIQEAEQTTLSQKDDIEQLAALEKAEVPLVVNTQIFEDETALKSIGKFSEEQATSPPDTTNADAKEVGGTTTNTPNIRVKSDNEVTEIETTEIIPEATTQIKIARDQTEVSATDTQEETTDMAPKINPEVLELRPVLSTRPSNASETPIEAEITTLPPQWLKKENETRVDKLQQKDEAEERDTANVQATHAPNQDIQVTGTQTEEVAEATTVQTPSQGDTGKHRIDDKQAVEDADKKDLFILEDFFTKLYRHQIATDATKH